MPVTEKNQAAVDLGKLGGEARAEKLSRKRKLEISRMGVEASLRARGIEPKKTKAKK